MAEAHCLKIAKLHAQRSEDLRFAEEKRAEDLCLAEMKQKEDLRLAEAKRVEDLRIAEEKVNDVTSVLRQDTDQKLSNMQNKLTEMMMATLKAALTTNDNKRPADTGKTDNSPSDEKRVNVNSTPGKKLFPDTMHPIADPALDLQQHLYGNAPSSPMKE
jgi:hypothetical protein